MRKGVEKLLAKLGHKYLLSIICLLCLYTKSEKKFNADFFIYNFTLSVHASSMCT